MYHMYFKIISYFTYHTQILNIQQMLTYQNTIWELTFVSILDSSKEMDIYKIPEQKFVALNL